MNNNIVSKAQQYMHKCTIQNKAPARELTEIAIFYGQKLAKEYAIDENKVLTALYLAHCVFSDKRGSDTMKSHTTLSAEQAHIRLQEHKVSPKNIDDICTAIELHHTTQDSENIFYEVVKNAESFKFLTRRGITVFLHHLGERGLTYQEAQEYATYKVKQKQSYLTLPQAKIRAQKFLDEYHSDIEKNF